MGEPQTNEQFHYEIAQSLAQDFESIYYIDLNTSSYLMYDSSGQFKTLDMQDSGDDFFADAQRDVIVVYDDDRDLVSNAMKRETLERETSDGRVFRFDYRLLIDGEPIYYNAKATRSILDDSHVIIGVSNIHRQKEQEKEYVAKLQRALELAQRDELTSVRNRNAYMKFESELNELIADGSIGEFAVVICDLNNLKIANDKLGHTAGDQLLKNACHTICVIYDHSPVFRIGGDEFVCILRGHDYECRDELFAKLTETSLAAATENRRAGVTVDADRPVVACGMGVFDPETDRDVTTVFARADANMYESKKHLKSLQ